MSCSWLKDTDIKLLPQWHSDAMCFRLVLLAMKDRRHYPTAVIGYYLGGLIQEWRIAGSPSRQEPTHWMPLPTLPRDRCGINQPPSTALRDPLQPAERALSLACSVIEAMRKDCLADSGAAIVAEQNCAKQALRLRALMGERFSSRKKKANKSAVTSPAV